MSHISPMMAEWRACRVRRQTSIKETRPKFNNGNAARSLHIWLAVAEPSLAWSEAVGPRLYHQPGPDQRLFHFDDVMIHPYAVLGILGVLRGGSLDDGVDRVSAAQRRGC